jgi:hypothetical protein
MASTIALYSASVLDLDTVFYFFAHRDIKLGPTKTAKTPCGLPITSASCPIYIQECANHSGRRSSNIECRVHASALQNIGTMQVLANFVHRIGYTFSAKSPFKSCSNSSTAEEDEPATMMSLTYIRRKIVTDPFL